MENEKLFFFFKNYIFFENFWIFLKNISTIPFPYQKINGNEKLT